MKRVLLLAVALMMLCGVKAQKPVYFYGIDFTQVKSYGEMRTAEEFRTAFMGINRLMYTEADKYNFGEMLGCTYQTDLQPMLAHTQRASFSDVVSYGTEIPILDVPSIVRGYELQQKAGRGMIFIARVLHKYNERGYFYAVLFDIATREIILMEEVNGQARGFGLRNHWAAPLYQISKNSRWRVN